MNRRRAGTCKLLYIKFKPYDIAALVECHRALAENVAMMKAELESRNLEGNIVTS